MALEPRVVTMEEEENPELKDMKRRFWVSVALTLPVLFLAMSEMIPGQPIQHALSPRLLTFINSRWPRRSCCGEGGCSSSAAGPR